ncbi:hypothetical protein ColTof3_01574 [Colletotrichum tofieldiae]|nr:hypothetical protein ColTof3_01574 [Colletotrichum tofieldiae]
MFRRDSAEKSRWLRKSLQQKQRRQQQPPPLHKMPSKTQKWQDSHRAMWRRGDGDSKLVNAQGGPGIAVMTEEVDAGV